jgi:murein DD-endopeptidase MepM/ murein hydrolase activator NlpD
LFLAIFCAGTLTGWLLHSWSIGEAVPRAATRDAAVAIAPAIAIGPAGVLADQRKTPAPADPSRIGPPPGHDAAVAEIRDRGLRLPLDDVNVESLKGNFGEHRSGSGGHQHEAADMLAPRNTPIHAVDTGTIAKLFFSQAGGRTIYQFDPGGRFCYYYAHLERYAPGLKEGGRVARGDVIGYVGTSGNAPPGTPHLHFAVFVLGPERHWWQGTAIDPYEIYER